jgi:hypothetical protein
MNYVDIAVVQVKQNIMLNLSIFERKKLINPVLLSLPILPK